MNKAQGRSLLKGDFIIVKQLGGTSSYDECELETLGSFFFFFNIYIFILLAYFIFIR